MAITDILDKQFIIFGGKGGVGKTTCAAATALALLPRKTIIVSTDPAHSLADCLEQEIGDRITRVEAGGNLYALEISAQNTYETFKQDHRREMLRLLESSAGIEHLTPRERDSLLSLPVPGADEVMGLKRLMDLMEEGTFEKYVLDTAPTGHALRLLSMPDIFDKWLNLFYKLRDKHRFHERAFSKPDRADEFLLSLKKSTAKLRNLLRSKTTEFVVVTAAERLVIQETKDLVSQLILFGIPVGHLIINKLFPDLSSDFARIRREQEHKLVKEAINTFSELEIIEVFLQSVEPQGIENLRRFASILYNHNDREAS
ncbi:MAG: ArsA family ATPase [Dehalococcoidales bacterium]|nr:ArsA family ATPase [Dehalococcoidales bacterium]